MAESWPNIVDGLTENGDGYQQARRAFGVLLARHGQAMFLASRSRRRHVREPQPQGRRQRPASVRVDSGRQAARSARLLEEQVFSDKPFNFPPELYNHLAASHWDHWGVTPVERGDYPVHDVILMWQDRILSKLLSSLTLARLHDTELKVPADQDALTDAELIERLTKAIFSETTA